MVAAFAGAVVLGIRGARRRGDSVSCQRSGRRRTATVMQAGADDQPPKRTLTKSEEMALRLGRDLAKETEKSSKQAEAAKNDVESEDFRNKFLAVVGVAVGFFSYFQEKAHPLSGAFLLEKMAANSITLEEASRNGKPTVVEFYADWCKNCKEMAPHVKRLEEKYIRQVNFVVVDGDDEANADLVDLFGVDGLPHISLLEASLATSQSLDLANVKATFVGYTPEDILDRDLAALLKHEKLPHQGFSLSDILKFKTDDTPY